MNRLSVLGWGEKKIPSLSSRFFHPFPKQARFVCIQYQTEVTRVELIRLWPAWQVLERKGKGVFLTQFSPQTTGKKDKKNPLAPRVLTSYLKNDLHMGGREAK